MLKVFFVTFFIAEFIIFLALILKIYTFNRKVNLLSSVVVGSKEPIKKVFVDLRFLLKGFNSTIVKIKEYIVQKKQEYMITTFKNMFIYSSILFLRGKWSGYRNFLIAYEIGKEVYDGFKEV